MIYIFENTDESYIKNIVPRENMNSLQMNTLPFGLQILSSLEPNQLWGNLLFAMFACSSTFSYYVEFFPKLQILSKDFSNSDLLIKIFGYCFSPPLPDNLEEDPPEFQLCLCQLILEMSASYREFISTSLQTLEAQNLAGSNEESPQIRELMNKIEIYSGKLISLWTCFFSGQNSGYLCQLEYLNQSQALFNEFSEVCSLIPPTNEDWIQYNCIYELIGFCDFFSDRPGHPLNQFIIHVVDFITHIYDTRDDSYDLGSLLIPLSHLFTYFPTGVLHYLEERLSNPSPGLFTIATSVFTTPIRSLFQTSILNLNQELALSNNSSENEDYSTLAYRSRIDMNLFCGSSLDMIEKHENSGQIIPECLPFFSQLRIIFEHFCEMISTQEMPCPHVLNFIANTAPISGIYVSNFLQIITHLWE